MRNDPIVEEVRKVREAHAACFDYDLDRIYQDLKDSEKERGRETVSREPKRFLKATGS